MSHNPNLSKTTSKQQRQSTQQRQNSKRHQEQSQPAQQPQTDFLNEEEPATALPSLEKQLDCFAELLIDLYLQNQ